MAKKNLGSKGRTTVLAAAAFAAGLGIADAAVYKSEFDPINFLGNAYFDVGQACIDAVNGWGEIANGISGCTVNWLTAEVTLKSGSDEVTFQYEDGSTFQPNVLPDLFAVQSVYLQNGELVGVKSSVIGYKYISGQTNTELNGPWWLQFGFDTVEILGDFAPDFAAPQATLVIPKVNLYTGYCDVFEGEGFECWPNLNAPIDVAEVVTFTRVPEPGSLALLLGALGAGWLSRRRATRN